MTIYSFSFRVFFSLKSFISFFMYFLKENLNTSDIFSSLGRFVPLSHHNRWIFKHFTVRENHNVKLIESSNMFFKHHFWRLCGSYDKIIVWSEYAGLFLLIASSLLFNTISCISCWNYQKWINFKSPILT